MADHQDGEAGGLELVFEGFDGEDVEVVGRLVQQQQVRLFGEGASEVGAARLAAGEALCGLFGVQAEGLQPLVGGPGIGAARGRVIAQGRADDGGLLRDIGEASAGLQRAFARVRLDQAHDQPHQSGLARAVPADQAGVLARLDGQVDAVEQGERAVLQADVAEGNERGAGHGGETRE